MLCWNEVRDHKDRLALTVFMAIVKGRNLNFEPLRVARFGAGLFPLKLCLWAGQKSKPDKHTNDKSNRNCRGECDSPLIGFENLHDYIRHQLLSRTPLSSVTSPKLGVVGPEIAFALTTSEDFYLPPAICNLATTST